jgi:hypothetical protein
MGIAARDNELRTQVMVADDGANPFITCGTELREKPPARHLAFGIKATVALLERLIEDRHPG